MKTVFMTGLLLCQIFCTSFSFYFYLSHEDLDRNLIQPIELSEQMSHVSYLA